MLEVEEPAESVLRLVGRQDAALGDKLTGMLADRPLAYDEPAPTLTALTNRMVAYMEAAAV